MKARRYGCLLAFALCLMMGSAFAWQNQTLDLRQDYPRDIAFAGDTLYVLRESGLWQYRSNAENAGLVAETAALPDKISHILSDGRTLYAITSEEKQGLYALTPDEENKSRLLLPLDPEAHPSISAPSIRGDSLVYQADGSLTHIHLPDGAWQTHDLPDLTAYFRLTDTDALLLIRKPHTPYHEYQIVRYDLLARQSTPLCSITAEQPLQYIGYDEKSEQPTVFAREGMYAVSPDGALTQTLVYTTGDLAAVRSNADQSTLALIIGDLLVIRNTNDTAAPQTLTLLFDAGHAEDYPTFLAQYPQAMLRFLHPGKQTHEERFAQDMAAQDGSIDIYFLKDLNLLPAIAQKAYYADLSADADIKANLANMYPAYAAPFLHEGHIIGYPVRTFVETVYYHVPAFQALELPVPATYAEYMALCRQLAENPPGENIAVNATADELLNLENLLSMMAFEQMKNGRPITLHTPQNEAVLRDYLAAQANSDSGSWQSTALFRRYDVMTTADADYAPLHIPFDKELSWGIYPAPENIGYFVINPRSPNQELARRFIAQSTESQTEVERAMLFASVTQPIENPLFIESQAQYQRELDELTALYQTCEDKEKQDVQTQIDAKKLEMERNEARSRWAVTQDMLDRYRKVVHHVYIPTRNPIYTIQTRQSDFFNQLQAGSEGDFLRQLDEKIRLIEREQQ